MMKAYPDLLRYARRVSRRADEAEDVVQDVLLAAVRQNRADLSIDANRRWLMGAIRKHAAFLARSAARRRTREAVLMPPAPASGEGRDFSRACDALPATLRTTARLIGGGHTKQEILWLLRISDVAFRQRVADIRRRLRSLQLSSDTVSGLTGHHAFGRIRRGLIPPVSATGAFLASHDPDGHTFLLTLSSRNGRPWQQDPAKSKENPTHVCQPQDR